MAKNRRFAKTETLTLQDLNGEYLVMPIEGVSEELDAFRNEIKQNHLTVQIIDSAYYWIDTFTMCEVNPYILITQPVYSDIHTNLVTNPNLSFWYISTGSPDAVPAPRFLRRRFAPLVRSLWQRFPFPVTVHGVT